MEKSLQHGSSKIFAMHIEGEQFFKRNFLNKC